MAQSAYYQRELARLQAEKARVQSDLDGLERRLDAAAQASSTVEAENLRVQIERERQRWLLELNAIDEDLRKLELSREDREARGRFEDELREREAVRKAEVAAQDRALEQAQHAPSERREH